jgi:hypothetical protein
MHDFLLEIGVLTLRDGRNGVARRDKTAQAATLIVNNDSTASNPLAIKELPGPGLSLLG